ncbi:hypothetical protein HDU76_011998 [Blyttiomyces sp. JEL0837]|nr:hypothetical protein HDU76_011998 [Blyttiomyces sp. JEL0837]
MSGLDDKIALWSLCEHFLESSVNVLAANLDVSPPDVVTAKFSEYVTAAIACLEAVLKLPAIELEVVAAGKVLEGAQPFHLTALDEVKTRFKLAEILFYYLGDASEAEKQVQRATQNWKQAKNASKSGMSDAANAAAEAETRKDFDIQAAFLLMRASVALTQRNRKEMSETVRSLQKLFCPQPVQMEDNPAEGRPASMGPVARHPPLVTHQDLVYMFHLLCIMYSMQCGNMKQATAELKEFHKLLESHPTNSKARSAEMAGLSPHATKLSVTASINVSSLNLKAPIRIFSIPQVFTLSYLLSGIVWKGVDSTRSEQFLKEALNSVTRGLMSRSEVAGDLDDVIALRLWFAETKIICLHHLVGALILKGNFAEANERLIECLEACGSNSDILQKYWGVILLDWGLLHQAQGKIDEAVRCFLGAAEAAGPDLELRTVSTLLNACLLFATGQKERIDLANIMIQELQRDPTTMAANPENIKALNSTALGLSCLISNESKKTKQHILDTLKFSDSVSSNHLKMMGLTLLGGIFLDMDLVQAQKMFGTAHKLAQKLGCGSFASVCAGVMSELHRRGNNLAEANKYAALSNLSNASNAL